MDTTTQYLGFDLPHPLIPGAGPLGDTLDTVRQLEDAGAPMIMLSSIFEEQITHEQVAMDRAISSTTESYAEASSYLPQPHEFVFGQDEYLEHVTRLRHALDIPVVGSLNGTTAGGWLEYAKLIEQAGAHALELNVYDAPTDPLRPGESIERELIAMVKQVKQQLTIPIAVKLSPFYTSLPNLAANLSEAGADALVLFNRFYQPDIDTENLEVISSLHLSNSSELLLRLRWLAILHGRFCADLAVTGGVHHAEDIVKAVMCGASAVQVVSVLLKFGASHLQIMIDELTNWLIQHEYDSLNQMHGSMSLLKCPDPKRFERCNYMQILQSWQI